MAAPQKKNDIIRQVPPLLKIGMTKALACHKFSVSFFAGTGIVGGQPGVYVSSNGRSDVTISCLQHAIEDTQGTIRAYDSKAEILAILLTVALGITNFTLLQQAPTALSKSLLGASWVVALIALGLLGRVLRPKKNLFQELKCGSYTPTGAYFLFNVLSCPQNTVSELAKKAVQTDWVSELTYESMKLSLIRDRKHACLMSALWAAGAALLLVVITVVVEVAAWQAI